VGVFSLIYSLSIVNYLVHTRCTVDFYGGSLNEWDHYEFDSLDSAIAHYTRTRECIERCANDPNHVDNLFSQIESDPELSISTPTCVEITDSENNVINDFKFSIYN
jgi:hypothetical protein